MGGKAAILFVIGFSFIMVYVTLTLTSTANRAQGNMSNYAAATESHNLAVAGANVGLAAFYQDTSWRGTATQDLSKAFNGSFTYGVTDGPDGRPMLRSVSRVRGPQGMISDTVEIVFGGNLRQTFTLFAWLTNDEGNVTWITGDTVWGRVHSNSQMHMSGTPTFMGKLTTSKGIDPKWGTGKNHAVFKNGFETGVARIGFPTDLSETFGAATSGGRSYTGNIEVRLKDGGSGDNDGYALVYSGSKKIDSVSLGNPSFNGVIAGTGKVSVQGTLDGSLSIVSASDVYIIDDIYYANRNVSTSNDVLGLIAERDVTVANNKANSTGCNIDGSIFCRNGSFGVEDYSKGGPRGELRLLGSIVQDTRGAVGTFNSGTSTLKTGYSKRYRYDDRLADVEFRPPFYPGFWSRTRAITAWWESVHMPEFFR